MSFWRAYYHLVWTTRDRLSLIAPDIEARLYAYLVRKAAELGVYVYAINGIEESRASRRGNSTQTRCFGCCQTAQGREFILYQP